MNVLYLTHRLPYQPNRGDRIRAFYMLRAMGRFARVSLFSFVHDDEEAASVGSVEAHRVAVSRVHRLPSMVRAGLGLVSRRPLTHLLLDAPDARRHLASLVADARPDVVLAYCSSMARLALEPPLDGIPFVMDIVDVDSAKWARLSTSSAPPKSWIYAREANTLGAFEARAAARARQSLAVNDRERQELLRIAPGAHVQVVPNGIDWTSFRRPGQASRKPVVSFCGVMDYAPNEQGVLWFVRDVWPIVRRQRRDAEFMIVGARPTRAIRALAEADPSITVTGSVPAVQPLLWEAAVSVAPLALSQGLQNKVLEALAASLPVVITPQVADGLPDGVKAACPVSTSAEEFAAEVLRLLAMSPEQRTSLASAAALSQYGWEQSLAPLQAILEESAALPESRSTASAPPR
jgi:sugar transferase (PEP-CTERM/EpsH1 system associated)